MCRGEARIPRGIVFIPAAQNERFRLSPSSQQLLQFGVVCFCIETCLTRSDNGTERRIVYITEDVKDLTNHLKLP